MGYTNQPEEVIDELANILKSQNESSLTEETEQPVQEEQTEVQETGEVQQEEPTLENAEMPEQESSEITAEDYEAMKAELEKLKSAGNNVDVDWFKSEDGQLYLMDLDEISVEDDALELNIEFLMDKEGFTLEEAEEELKFKYPNLFEEDPDEESSEYKAEYRKFIRDARSQLDILKNKKSELEVPFRASSSEGQIAEEDLDKAYQERFTQTYQQEAQMRSQIANELVKGRETTNLSIGDFELEYEMSPEVKDKIMSDLTDLPRIGAQFVKDNKIDNDALFLFLALKNDAENILRIAANKKAAEARENTIKTEIKNSNFNSKSPQTPASNPYPEGHRLHDAFAAMTRGQ